MKEKNAISLPFLSENAHNKPPPGPYPRLRFYLIPDFLAWIIHSPAQRKWQGFVHQRERSDADAECSKPYFQGEGASIALRCKHLLFAVVRAVNDPG